MNSRRPFDRLLRKVRQNVAADAFIQHFRERCVAGEGCARQCAKEAVLPVDVSVLDRAEGLFELIVVCRSEKGQRRNQRTPPLIPVAMSNLGLLPVFSQQARRLRRRRRRRCRHQTGSVC
jgi:hypothetical protein